MPAQRFTGPENLMTTSTTHHRPPTHPLALALQLKPFLFSFFPSTAPLHELLLVIPPATAFRDLLRFSPGFSSSFLSSVSTWLLHHAPHPKKNTRILKICNPTIAHHVGQAHSVCRCARSTNQLWKLFKLSILNDYTQNFLLTYFFSSLFSIAIVNDDKVRASPSRPAMRNYPAIYKQNTNIFPQKIVPSSQVPTRMQEILPCCSKWQALYRSRP